MRIALAGTGAFGIKHLDGLANIDGVTSRPWSAVGWSRPKRSPASTASATPRPTWTRSSPATTSTR